MVRYIFLVLGLTVFAAVANSQSPSVTGRQEATSLTERRKPAVNVQQQTGSPLRISLKTKWVGSDVQMLEIYAVVENVSDLEIRAYALRSFAGADGTQSKAACLLHNIQSPGKMLRPGDSDGKSMWRSIPLDRPSFDIELSLDFVEFANSSTWGVDACQSADRLGGLRAGALAAKNKLARMLDQDNGKALINMLNFDAPILEATEGHSPVWVESFQGGVRTLFERVRKANEEGGPPEAERVLRLPF